MRSHFVWLVLILVAVGLAARWNAGFESGPNIQELRLVLSRQPTTWDGIKAEGISPCYDLTLQREGNRLTVLSLERQGPGKPKVLFRKISAIETASLEQNLWRLPGWKVAEVDSGEPEARVLYTFLRVRTSDSKEVVSRWRGLPPAQAEVARVLQETAFGADLRRAVEQLLR